MQAISLTHVQVLFNRDSKTSKGCGVCNWCISLPAMLLTLVYLPTPQPQHSSLSCVHCFASSSNPHPQVPLYIHRQCYATLCVSLCHWLQTIVASRWQEGLWERCTCCKRHNDHSTHGQGLLTRQLCRSVRAC